MKDNKIKYRNFIRDLIYLLKDDISDMKNNKSLSDIDLGQLISLENTINLIKNQADAFNINLDKIGFNDFEKYQIKKSEDKLKKYFKK